MEVIFCWVSVCYLVWRDEATSRFLSCESLFFNGTLAVFHWFVGMFTIENGYRATREIRAGYRDHFRHYWNEKCPRVCNHDIVLEQREDSLSMSSDMELYNPYEESLNQLILFLNPGLQVKTLMVENKEIPFQREGQVLVIPHTLLGKDNVSLHAQYEGQIDERFTNLQLRDSAYEDSFQGDFSSQQGGGALLVMISCC
ncbi:MAG: hypothetical protein ACLU4J_25075 [Butyricimonas paravirosa]